MNEKAPITWLIDQINQLVGSGVDKAAGALTGAITPIIAACFGIYIILICINYMRGAETEPVIDFCMRIAGFAIIIGIGLNAKTYSGIVIPIVKNLGNDLAGVMTGGSSSSGTLDDLALHYFGILDRSLTEASSPIFPRNIGPLSAYYIKAALILLGLIPFLVAATVTIIIANVGSIMVAMVGPLFFAFLLFPATRQYFSAWVSTALSYALIPVFVAVISIISIGLSKEMFTGGNDTITETSLTTVFLASIGNLTLLFLLRQVSSLASSLSAGGINAAMPGSIGTLASGIKNSVAGTAKEIKGIKQWNKGRIAARRKKAAKANQNNSIRKAG